MTDVNCLSIKVFVRVKPIKDQDAAALRVDEVSCFLIYWEKKKEKLNFNIDESILILKNILLNK